MEKPIEDEKTLLKSRPRRSAFQLNQNLEARKSHLSDPQHLSQGLFLTAPMFVRERSGRLTHTQLLQSYYLSWGGMHASDMDSGA